MTKDYSQDLDSVLTDELWFEVDDSIESGINNTAWFLVLKHLWEINERDPIVIISNQLYDVSND